MNYKTLVSQFLPPAFTRVISQLQGKIQLAEWEYQPNGWSTENRSKAWNSQSIPEAQRDRWPAFVRSLEGTNPITSTYTWESPELTSHNINAHNLAMTYGYVLALAAKEKRTLSILDWGSGIGHYYLISKALMSNLNIQYFCHDLPSFCQIGKKLLPEVNFLENPGEVFKGYYDFVFASNSLQYSPNWKEVISKLSATTRGFLYIAQLPVVQKVKSFVILQRPYLVKHYHYNSEYLGWVLNRQEFVKHLRQKGMRLQREFLMGSGPLIRQAPEHIELFGFLFVPSSS